MSATGSTSDMVIDIDLPADDATAMDAAFDRCSRALYRYVVVRVGDAHLADDLMQQLWLQARNSRADVPKNELEFWLRSIARNLVRTHWRTQARRPASVPLPDPELAADLADRLVSEELPPELLERKEVQDQMLLAITELTADEQELIVEHYFHDRSHAQLADRLGLSPRAIEGRLYRARQALRERLRHQKQRPEQRC
jgi:RNA polymerase sigma factor (sigma-70 family)